MYLISLHYLLLFSRVLEEEEIVLWFVERGQGFCLFGVGSFFSFFLYTTVTTTNQAEHSTRVTDCHQPENSIQLSKLIIVPGSYFFSFVRYSNFKFCYHFEHSPHQIS